MINRKKKMPPFDLSPEVDQFLREAIEEHNRNNEVLIQKWSFGNLASWGFDQITGILSLQLKDGSYIEADGQVLGSYAPGEGTWEWAWNNPTVLDHIKKDSFAVRKYGEEHQIDYLCAPFIPIPNEMTATYLAAIGEKITKSQGVFPANAGPIEAFILLKKLRRKG